MLVFFDFDGTIADSLLIAEEVIAEIGGDYGLLHIDKAQLIAWKSKRIPELLAATGIRWSQLPEIMINARKSFQQKREAVPLFEGMKETLEALHQYGVELQMLTSNSAANVRYILEKYQINVFSEIHSPGLLFGKSAVIQKVMRKRDLPASAICMVGDEIRDIEAAKKAGVTSVAVSWGFNHPDLLALSEPDFLLHSPQALKAQLLQLAEKNIG